MQIRTVNNKQDLSQFIEIPYRLYRGDPIWIAPLRSDQWNQFDPKRNPMLDHCGYALFLLVDGQQTLGRISAFVDRLAVDWWKEPIGLFGSFECIADKEAARLLLAAAQSWLADRGMKSMRGPWSFASQEWGLVVEGFEPSPVIMAPYNPPRYNDYVREFGFEKAKDLLVYYVDAREGYRIPERYLRLTDRVQARLNVSVRSVDMRNLERDVATLVRLANRSIADNWGFYPVTEDEGKAMARDMKPIADPRLLLLAEDSRGEAVGFAMALPDVNTLLKGLNGRLFPFGWLKLLFGLPRIRQFRMWALGVVPEYQGKAVDALLYRKLHELLAGRDVRMEINYVLEDNYPMNNALKNLGVKDLRRYRVYQKSVSA
jgi:ribosomal protein S18 acetylase RimI-like enzyme